MSQWRALTTDERAGLTRQGCTCTDWSKLRVAEGFSTERIEATHFSGDIKLGRFTTDVSFPGGLSKPTGVYHATLHHCTIGNNVYINRIGGHIANYTIEDNAVIENVDVLAVDGPTSFGNGVKVAVVNEAGGREVPIYDGLSAQTAYVLAFYRHRPALIAKLEQMIATYADSVTSSQGLIGKAAAITNSRILRNVRIGPGAVIEGVNRLENGSINSSTEDPVYIGPGVYAENFIAASGSKITDGAIVCECFVGQGAILAKEFSAENSLFLANCEGFHGEACALLAGPYTVTHHKSTLLIAGLFSFCNAGSGTNQSNHMYKLGPVHQGIVERGGKTASDSYMLWPAKVGAFTAVIGRHYSHCDTSDLPFSYLIGEKDKSVLAPAVNLRSVGTARDAGKWPRRDRRKDSKKLDRINFKLLSPYTVQKMLNGRDLLTKLRETADPTFNDVTYNGVVMRKDSLEHGIELYQAGIDMFLGNCLIERLESKRLESLEDLRAALRPETDRGRGRWLDLAGMFAPSASIEQLLDDVEAGRIATLDGFDTALDAIHDGYAASEWNWAVEMIGRELGKDIASITAEEIITLVQRGQAAVENLDRRLGADAEKEFAPAARIGFGVDGDEDTRDSDFKAVRGSFETNEFVAEIDKRTAATTAQAQDLIARIEPLCRS